MRSLYIARLALLFPMMLVIYEVAVYLANDMYLPSLPLIAQSLGVSQDQAQWTLSLWFVGAASMQLVLGPLSDNVGRRPIMIISALLFVLASIVCAITTQIEIMYVARFIQGITVCCVGVAGYGAIHELYDTHKAIQLLAIMGSITLLAPALGPTLGAVVVTYADYTLIFYILAGLGAIACLGLSLSMPETLKESATVSLSDVIADYKKMLSNRLFIFLCLTLSLHLMAIIIWIVESPFIIQETYEYDALVYGGIQLLIFGQFIIGSQFLRVLVKRCSVNGLISFGLWLATLSIGFMVYVNFFYKESLEWTVGALMIEAFGSSFAFGALNRLAVDASEVPMGRRMALISTFTSTFAAIGTILVTSFNDATLNNLSAMMIGPQLVCMLTWLICLRIFRSRH